MLTDVVPLVMTRSGSLAGACNAAVTLVTLHTSGDQTVHVALTVSFIAKLGLVISARPVISSGVMVTAMCFCY